MNNICACSPRIDHEIQLNSIRTTSSCSSVGGIAEKTGTARSIIRTLACKDISIFLVKVWYRNHYMVKYNEQLQLGLVMLLIFTCTRSSRCAHFVACT